MKGILALVVVAAIAIGGLIYFGVISKEDVEQTGRKAMYDAKGVAREIVEPPAGISGNAKQMAAACRENLKRIESAKRQAASSRAVSANALSWADLEPSLGKRPSCPAGGRYSINSIGMTATCSIGGNQTAEVEDDHMIRNF